MKTSENFFSWAEMSYQSVPAFFIEYNRSSCRECYVSCCEKVKFHQKCTFEKISTT